MAKTRRAYAPEFRHRMVELVRAGRSPEQLAKEFEPTAKSIREWVAQVDRDEGRRERRLDERGARRVGAPAAREQAARAGARNPLESRGLVCSGDGCDPVEGFQFTSANRAVYPIIAMSRLLGVSPSGFYAWIKRPPSRRCQADAAMTAKIRAAHATSKGAYGAPRIQADLVAEGIRAGLKRIARLMRAAGLSGVSRRKGARTTIRDDGTAQAPDLVDRNFVAERPNQLWVADITDIPTWAGFLYLAVVLDAFSRRIVGWSMALTLHTRLVLDALDMALMTRRPEGVIHHSDHGSRYTSIGFGKRCREAGVRPSMGSVGVELASL